MSSERRIQSSRENGRKSRGPVSPRGKANSAGSALRHGLCAKTLLLDQESAVRFNQVVTGLYDEYRPETPSEVAAVEAMAFARWRQLRLWTLEQCTLNAAIRRSGIAEGPAVAVIGALAQIPATATPADNTPANTTSDDACTRTARAWVELGDRSNALNLFARYENLYERQFARALRRLEVMRDYRKSKNAERSHHVVENNGSDRKTEPTGNPE